MEKKKVVPVWVTVVLAVVCLAIIFYHTFVVVQLIDDMSFIALVTYCTCILASLSALIYCVSGYKKNTALFFKIFCIMNAVASLMPALMCIDIMETNTLWVVNAILMLARAVLYIVFAFMKDLGKKKSFRIYIALLAICVMYSIFSTIIVLYMIFFSIYVIVIEGVFGIMIYGKYADKATRGTK